MIYNDMIGLYNLLDYNRTHSQLLLRKRENGVNTDILFKSVQSIFMPLNLNGLGLKLVEDLNELVDIQVRYGMKTELGYKIYQIETEGPILFYINAGAVGVFINELDILESPLGDSMWSDSNKLIHWVS